MQRKHRAAVLLATVAFRFDADNPCSEGVMDTVRQYYELEPPRSGTPDVVRMIHWGAGYYLINPATRYPMGDPDQRRIHSQTVEQVAYVVWAWPALEKWLPRSFYEKCRKFRHAEGWVNYGAAWCISLAYLELEAAATTPAP